MKKSLIVVGLILATCITISTVAGAILWTTQLTGAWTSTTNFNVYTDAAMTTTLGASTDLGSYSQAANTGTKTFYIKNTGDVSVTVYPHLANTLNLNAISYTPSTGLVLAPGASGTITMAFTVIGTPSASMSFDTSP